MSSRRSNPVIRYELATVMAEMLGTGTWPSKPGRQLDIRPAAAPDLTKLEFDFDVLRLMVNIKLAQRPIGVRNPGTDHGFQPLARELGVSDQTIGSFCRGRSKTLTMEVTVKLLAWLGHMDLTPFTNLED